MGAAVACAQATARLKPPIPTASALTRVDVETWADGLIPFALDKGDVPGAVVIVVKDGQILFAKGYGYADTQNQVPVEAQRTLFRVGSVSKLFAWTAVMQLVEQGKLDLDRDVNDYLDFKIPPAFGKPITMRNLLTHTAGFADTMKASGPADVKALKPLGDYLKAHLPARILPPGDLPGYSNYGVTLAGYVVERISGERFEDYMQRHVLAPLGMQSSTFHQPLPASLAVRLAKGYKAAGMPPWYFEPINPVPAGALSATGTDIARFMLAHLQNGALDGQRILREDTARAMHEYNAPAIKPFSGMALGFIRIDRNGRRIIGHGGATAVFHCNLVLYPDDGVGLFVARNAGGNATSGALDEVVFDQFTDRYFPAAAPPQESTVATAREHARLIAGRYEPTRRFETSFLGALPLIGLGQSQLSANADGTVVLHGLGTPQIYREIGPFLWRESGGPDRLAARVENGRVVAIRTERFPPIAVWQPVAWWKSASWHETMLPLSLVVLLLTVIFWPATALVRRHYRVPPPLTGREAVAQRWTRVTALVDLVFIGGWAVVIMAGWQNIATFNPSLDPWLRLLQLLGLLAVAGAAVAVWHAWRVWHGPRRWLARVWSIVVAFACVEIVWFAFAGRLMTLSLNY